MSKRDQICHLPDGTTAYLEMHPITTILQDKGLDPQGSAQRYHTQNVLRRIIKYMACRSGITNKITIAQTDISKPEIVTDTPYAYMLFTGISASGKPIKYTKTKHPLAGPRPDKALSAAEGAAMAADLQRFLKRKR